MPSITAVRILSEFSVAGFTGNVACWAQIQMLHWSSRNINSKFLNPCTLLYIFHIFLYLSLSCSLRLICAPVSLKEGSLRPKAVSKLPGVVLWLRCTSRGPAGWWHGSRQRSGLLGILMCGIGCSVRWLLTHLREPSMGCWLALCTLTDAGSLKFTLSGVSTGAGILLSHWVAGLSHLRAEHFK